MTLYHIALFKTKEGATQADVDKVLEFANTLPGKIPCIVSAKAGKATGMAATHGKGFEWGVIVTLGSLEDLGTYQKHPEHQPLMPLIHSAFGETLLFDFEA